MTGRRFTTPDFERCVAFYTDGANSRANPELALWLQANPQLARQAKRQADAQQQLRNRFDPVLDEAIPPRLLASRAPSTARWHTPMAVAATVALAIGVTWWLAPVAQHERAHDAPVIAQQQTTPNRPAVQTAADERQTTPQIRPAGKTLVPHPDLSAQGYTLQGTQTARSGLHPIMEFHYGNRQGSDLRIYAQNQPQRHTRLPLTLSENNLSVVRWRSNGIAYVMVGALPQSALQRLAYTAMPNPSGQPSQKTTPEAPLSTQLPQQTPGRVDQPVQRVATPTANSVQSGNM